METLGFLLSTVAFFAAPALAVGGVATAVSRWRAARQGEPLEAVRRRTRRAFWVGFAITIGLELIAFGLCLAALEDAFG